MRRLLQANNEQRLATEKRHPFSDAQKPIFERFGDDITLYDNLGARFRRSAAWTGLTMIGAVAVIPCAQFVYTHWCWSVAALIAGIGCFSITLWQYWRVIRRALWTQAARQPSAAIFARLFH